MVSCPSSVVLFVSMRCLAISGVMSNMEFPTCVEKYAVVCLARFFGIWKFFPSGITVCVYGGHGVLMFSHPLSVLYSAVILILYFFGVMSKCLIENMSC